jgi:predicted nucleic acid-binding protein
VNRLFLDTTVLIDLSKDSGDVVTLLKALVATGAVLGVSAVSVAEFFTAVPVPERRRWQHWIADFEYWDVSRVAALLAGAFRYELTRQGRVLHIPDAMMAATAVVTDATLVTSKIKDYPMPSLRLLRLGS